MSDERRITTEVGPNADTFEWADINFDDETLVAVDINEEKLDVKVHDPTRSDGFVVTGESFEIGVNDE